LSGYFYVVWLVLFFIMPMKTFLNLFFVKRLLVLLMVLLMVLLTVLLTAPRLATAQTAASSAPAIACEMSVRVDDSLRFKPDVIEIPSQCSAFKVVLRHFGRLPRVASPRNWVLVKSVDADGVARTGVQAGAENDFVVPGDDRVLASSEVIGRDEKVEINLPVQALVPGDTYTFLSTIPGFSPALRGSLVVLP